MACIIVIFHLASLSFYNLIMATVSSPRPGTHHLVFARVTAEFATCFLVSVLAPIQCLHPAAGTFLQPMYDFSVLLTILSWYPALSASRTLSPSYIRTLSINCTCSSCSCIFQLWFLSPAILDHLSGVPWAHGCASFSGLPHAFSLTWK